MGSNTQRISLDGKNKKYKGQFSKEAEHEHAQFDDSKEVVGLNI